MNNDQNSPFHKISVEKLICKICNKKCKDGRSISQHVLKHHHIHIKNYYDIYYKKENEGVCYCGKETKCDGLNGYFEYCSKSCSRKSPISQKRYHRTNQNRYGVKNPFCNSDKIKQSMINKHGVDNCMKLEEIKKKIRNTCIDHFGFKNPMFTNRCREIARENLLKQIQIQYNLKEPLVPCVSPKGRICLDELEQITKYKIHREKKDKFYFIDGYIEELNLAIEFDGRHNFKDAYKNLSDHDIKRQKELEDLGYIFYRIKQKEWNNNKDMVIQNFLNFVNERKLICAV